MFTGIIEEIGRIEQALPSGGNLKLRINAPKVTSDLKLGDSININGACQTVIEVKDSTFMVETVEETLKRTTLGQLKSGDPVNLERALHASDRLGGHLVTGHVDFVGRIRSVVQRDQSKIFEFKFPQDYKSQFVEKGSVAVDGISLTVVQVSDDSFNASVIPITIKETTLGTKGIGDSVNIETDMIGKYVQRFLNLKKGKNEITEEWLKKKGW